MKRIVNGHDESSDEDIWEYRSKSQKRCRNVDSQTSKMSKSPNILNIAQLNKHTPSQNNVDVNRSQILINNVSKLSQQSRQIKIQTTYSKTDSTKLTCARTKLRQPDLPSTNTNSSSSSSSTRANAIQYSEINKRPTKGPSLKSVPVDEQSGHCPICQMPFIALCMTESIEHHVSRCMNLPLDAEQECPYGISCDSSSSSHYRKLKHSVLAKYRDAGPENVESLLAPEAVLVSQLTSKTHQSCTPRMARKGTTANSTSPYFAMFSGNSKGKPSSSSSSSSSGVANVSNNDTLNTTCELESAKPYTKIKDLSSSQQRTAKRSLLSEYDHVQQTIQVCNKMKIPVCDSIETESSQESDTDIFAETPELKILDLDSGADDGSSASMMHNPANVAAAKIQNSNVCPADATPSVAHECFEQLHDDDVTAMIATALKNDADDQSDLEQQRAVEYVQSKAVKHKSHLTAQQRPLVNINEDLPVMWDGSSIASGGDSIVFTGESSFKENDMMMTPLASPVTPLMTTPQRTSAKVGTPLTTPTQYTLKGVSGDSQTPTLLLSQPQISRGNKSLRLSKPSNSTPRSRKKKKHVDEQDGKKQLSMLKFLKCVDSKNNLKREKSPSQLIINRHVKVEPTAKTMSDTNMQHVKSSVTESNSTNIDFNQFKRSASASTSSFKSDSGNKTLWHNSNSNTGNSFGIQTGSKQPTANVSTAQYGSRSYSKRPCPFYKKIPDTPFTVDAFNYGTVSGCKAYFLSHFHYDHYQGLTKNFQHPIYCSKVTANLVEKKIRVNRNKLHELMLEETYYIEGVEVVLLEANHCPGSVLFLFKLCTGQIVLHTGDFRANEAMQDYTALQGLTVHQLYLDTTYCDPSHSFPPQQEVIDLAVRLANEFIHANPNGIITVGSYTIGKERIFLAIAEALNSKICVTSEKKGILTCLEDNSINRRITLKGAEARVHVLPMKKLNYEDLSEYISSPKYRYSKVLAFQPTGWTHSHKTLSLEHIKPRFSRNNVVLYGIPYSEHSSYTEMKKFVQFLRPDKILPTVNNGNAQSRKKMEKLFCDWLSEGVSPSKRLRQASVNDWLSQHSKT